MNDVQTRMEDMVFPDDYERDERTNTGIAEFLASLITQLKLTEIARGNKSRDPSTLLDSMGLILALFESNDFDLFKSVFRVGICTNQSLFCSECHLCRSLLRTLL